MSVRLAMKYTEVETSNVTTLINDPNVVFEQKMDGTRVLAVVTQEGVRFLQSGGKELGHTAALQHVAGIRQPLARILGDTPGEIVFDGELMIRTGQFHVFDVPYLRLGGVEHVRPSDAYMTRRGVLEMTDLLAQWEGTPVSAVAQAKTWRQKKALYESVVAAGAEGVMAKDLRSPYEPGVRAKHSLKIKLVKTADVVVLAVDRPDPKHGSFTFGVNAGPWSGWEGIVIDHSLYGVLGKCSAIGKPDAKVGDVIEVAYLYRDDSGGLVQPRMLRIRDDKTALECDIDQFPAYSRAVVTFDGNA